MSQASRSRRIPSYRLHRASGRAVVTLNSKDFYLGPYNSAQSRREYDRLIAEWISNGRQSPQAANLGSIAVNELLAAYFTFAKSYYVQDGKPGKEYVAMKDAAKLVRALYGRVAVNDFGPLALKAVREKLIESDLCRRHINQRVNRVRRIFKWGVENELVPAPILHALQAVAPLKFGRTTARESKPVLPVADADVQAVIPFVSRQVAAMIRLQRLTGMRPGEVVLLRPQDIDRTGQTWVYHLNRHKTQYRGQLREIYFGPKAQEILREWLDRSPEKYCFSPLEAEAERNTQRKAKRQSPMTPSQAKRAAKVTPKRKKRERYSVDSYRRAITYGIKRAGSPHWHPHQLRHTCGTEVRKNFGLDAAQIILGHKHAAVTEVYAEADRQKAFNVIQQVG